MMHSRRAFLAAAAGCLVQSSCASLREPGCKQCARLSDQAAPMPPCRRMELRSWDEMTRAMPAVYTPRTEAELAALLAAIPEGKRVTFRAGGQSLDSQSLNDDIVISMRAFCSIGAPQRDEAGFYVVVGAGARWRDVLAAVAPCGLMPPSLVTAGEATVGGTLSADCLSRMSPVVGKEGEQIRSFRIVLSDGRTLTCRRDDPAPENKLLFEATIGGFGYLGAVVEVTFDLIVARSRPGERCAAPVVFTRSTRLGPTVDWDAALRALCARSQQARACFAGSRPLHRGAGSAEGAAPRALAPEWSALSMVAFFAGSATSANLLEQRYAEPQPLRPAPGGTYEASSAFPAFGQRAFTFAPTLVELSLDFGFPDGEFLDELSGWAFFLGNSSALAKQTAAGRGNRLNFTQHTYMLPAGEDASGPDTRPARRFIELVQARLHGADIRPLAIDFLYIPADRFLLSASRDLPGFAITLSFADRNRQRYAPDLHAVLLRLCHDCRTLGGRVHLVKNVVAERADLRAMYGDVAAELRRRKQHFDRRGLFHNEFFDRVFGV